MLGLPGFCLDDDIPWIASLNKLKISVGSHQGGNPDTWAEPLCSFIARFPRLEILDLLSSPRVEQKEFAALTRMLTLPKTKNLGLLGIYCLSGDLLSLLHKHQRTLQTVFVHLVTIDTRDGDSWQSLLAAIRDHVPLVWFRMRWCKTDDDTMWFEEGDCDISKDILVIGGDSCLYDSLISGLRKRSDGMNNRNYRVEFRPHIIS